MNDSVENYGWLTEEGPQSCGYLASEVVSILRRLSTIKSICDVGCGNGALAGQLASAGFRTVGVEYDAEGCRIARQAHPNIKFYNLGVQDLPSTVTDVEGNFDAVVSTEVIEHLFSPHLLPRFAKGLLKKGGVFVVSTPYHGYWKNLALALLNKWDHHHTALWHGGHIKFWSKRTLTGLLEAEGFKVVAFQGVGRLPFLWKSMIVVAVSD